MHQIDWKRVTEQLLAVTGTTPAQLAQQLGVSRQAVYRWLNAETEPRPTQRHSIMLLVLDALDRHTQAG